MQGLNSSEAPSWNMDEIMLKKRVIASLPLIQDKVVQSLQFSRYLPIGKLDIALEFLSSWGIDEIVVLDIHASQEGRLISSELIRKASRRCHVPLAIGGGIKTLQDAKILAKSGADKIVVNQLLWESPQTVLDIVEHFGSQFVIASLDVGLYQNQYCKYDSISRNYSLDPLSQLISHIEALGVGELLVNHVQRDGMKCGYDLDLFDQIKTHLPLLFQGGAKDAHSMLHLFQETSATSAVAGNFFHYSEHSVALVKQFLQKELGQFRLSTNYPYSSIDQDRPRAAKRPDSELEALIFEKIQVELI